MDCFASLAMTVGSSLRDELQPMLAVEVEYGRGRLLDRAARHVYHRPAVFGEETARGADLLGDRNTVDIVALGVGVEREQPVLADLNDSLGRSDEADDQRPAQF